MIEFIASGRVFDLVIVILALEGLALLVLSRLPRARAWPGPKPLDLAGFVVAGLGLALAARAAIHDQSWTLVAGGLTIAFLAHAYDLQRRWRVAVRRDRGAAAGS